MSVQAPCTNYYFTFTTAIGTPPTPLKSLFTSFCKTIYSLAIRILKFCFCIPPAPEYVPIEKLVAQDILTNRQEIPPHAKLRTPLTNLQQVNKDLYDLICFVSWKTLFPTKPQDTNTSRKLRLLTAVFTKTITQRINPSSDHKQCTVQIWRIEPCKPTDPVRLSFLYQEVDTTNPTPYYDVYNLPYNPPQQ